MENTVVSAAEFGSMIGVSKDYINLSCQNQVPALRCIDTGHKRNRWNVDVTASLGPYAHDTKQFRLSLKRQAKKLREEQQKVEQQKAEPEQSQRSPYSLLLFLFSLQRELHQTNDLLRAILRELGK